MVDRGCALLAQAVVEIARDSKMSKESAELHIAMTLEDYLRVALAGPDAEAGVIIPASRVGGSRRAAPSTAAP